MTGNLTARAHRRDRLRRASNKSRHTLFKHRGENSRKREAGWVILRGLSPSEPKETAMAAKVEPVPQGYHTVTPYLVVDGAEKIIRFMKEAFGAQAVFEPMMRPDGKVMH